MPDVKKSKELEAILKALIDPRKGDIDLITRAYRFAEKAHYGQKRYSGEPYFTHVTAVAQNLADMHMDAQTIAAGLLHDTMEDAEIPKSEIEKEFGKEVAFLVGGVTKLGKLKYRGLQRHTESLRKLFIATSKDIRVLIIKLADRLHNISTLEHVPAEKRQRIAMETLKIHAPIANRLSMGRIKGQLEDYAFTYAYPEEYKLVRSLLKERSKDNIKRLEKVYRTLQKSLAKEGITNVHSEYRIKRTYSLYQKLLKYNMDIDKIYDIAALRVIVPSVGDCYRVLGVVHSLWRPLPGRIKDYIAFPKPNGYQSLHTTIFTGDGSIVEVQIRTEEMDTEAKFGIASHLKYKEGLWTPNKKKKVITKKLNWVNQLIDWQKNISESGEYLENLSGDFFGDRVFIFTPQGDVVDLPVDSSPIDFAYAIHSAIGNHSSGAKVNMKMVALGTKLKNGDIVEIITKKSSHPTRKWLEYAKTTFAKKHIRSYLQKHDKLA